MTIIRANQDIMGTLVFGGVFERNPGLKVVCGGRRRLGTPLHVPNGSRLQASPSLAPTWARTIEIAERIFL